MSRDILKRKGTPVTRSEVDPVPIYIIIAGAIMSQHCMYEGMAMDIQSTFCLIDLWGKTDPPFT